VTAVLVSALLPLAVPPPEQYASRSLIWTEGVLRYEGYAGEANFFAYHLVFMSPLLLFLFAKFPKPRLARPVMLAALGASFFTLAMSFSRGGFVSMAAAMIILLVVERRNRAVMITGCAAVGAGLLAAPTIYWDRISSLLEAANYISADYAVLIRYETMRVALLLGARNPIFGVGPGNFIMEAGRYIPYVKNVHNVFLQAFAELGAPGAVALAALVVWNFLVVRSMMRRRDDHETALLGRMLFVQQAAVLVNSMFIPALYEHVFWIALVLPTVARLAYLGPPGRGSPGGSAPDDAGGAPGAAAGPTIL
jgi:O-antigen ligase